MKLIKKIKEYCVNCGKETMYTKDDPIPSRYGYVEGKGQYCFRCSYFGGLAKIKEN